VIFQKTDHCIIKNDVLRTSKEYNPKIKSVLAYDFFIGIICTIENGLTVRNILSFIINFVERHLVSPFYKFYLILKLSYTPPGGLFYI
jgi:hypothetical protein